MEEKPKTLYQLYAETPRNYTHSINVYAYINGTIEIWLDLSLMATESIGIFREGRFKIASKVEVFSGRCMRPSNKAINGDMKREQVFLPQGTNIRSALAKKKIWRRYVRGTSLPVKEPKAKK